MSLSRGFIAIVVLAATAACDTRSPLGPSSTTRIEGFLGALRELGLRVTFEGTVPRSETPYFSVDARRALIERSAVHGPSRLTIFEYPSEAAAAADAAAVSADGQPTPSVRISWVSTPRFYRQDRLIVLYVGCDLEVAAALGKVLGQPFVTGSAPCVSTGS